MKTMGAMHTANQSAGAYAASACHAAAMGDTLPVILGTAPVAVSFLCGILPEPASAAVRVFQPGRAKP